MLFEREVVTSDLFLEMAPLFEKHYKEISAFQDIPLKMDLDKYLIIEQAGNLRCFVIRDNEDDIKLIGYAIFFVHTNMHYSDSLQAVQDILYIDKDYRGQGNGQMFIDWCDQELKRMGVDLTYHHVKTKFNFGPMLQKIGYRHVENIYVRDLREKVEA